MNLLDAGIALGIINLTNTVLNIIWMVKLKNIQGNKELIGNLTEINKAKDEVIKDLTTQLKEQHKAIEELMQKKNAYKWQYHNKNLSHERLQGKLEALGGFKGHKE